MGRAAQLVGLAILVILLSRVGLCESESVGAGKEEGDSGKHCAHYWPL